MNNWKLARKKRSSRTLPRFISLVVALLAAGSATAELQNVELDGSARARNPDAFHTSGPHIDIKVQLKPGADGGQGLGSLFELKNTNDKVVLGAGFDDAHSTYYRDNNRQVTFYYRAPEPTFDIQRLGKPYDSERNAVRLIVDENKLVSFFRYGAPVQLKTLSEADEFVPLDAPWTGDAEGFCGTQWVDNKRLLFRNDGIRYDGEVIYATGRTGGRYFYDHGVMFIYHSNPDQLLVAPWKPGEKIAIEDAEVHDLVGVVFTWGMYNDEFLLTTNVGEFYSYRDGKLTQIRATDGKSWQGYSILRHYDKVLIGQYPTGSLYQYDENGLALFDPPIPVPEGVSVSSREAQTLAIHGGYLYVGVWPWGEVWRFDHEANAWAFVDRMFDKPALSAEDQEPYARAMKDKPAPYNAWGQRVVNLTNFKDALYIATMNKQGSPWIPEVHDFLEAESVQEYGTVHRLKTPAQVTAPFTWKESTELLFRMASGNLIIFQDGEHIGSCQLPPDLDLGDVSEAGLAMGNGIYGPSRGNVSLVEFRAGGD